MADFKRKGVIFGSQAIAKGIERVAVEVDIMMKKTEGAPLTRPSTYINILGGLGLAFGPEYLRTGATVKEVGEIAGFHMVNKVWDYLEEFMAPAPPAPAAGVPGAAARYAGYTPSYMAAESPGGAPEFYPPLYGQNVSREPVLRDHVRFTLTK